ncbi:RibD family protein [Alsobacter sp. SYSU BS001988]|jgi:riboflavin-specific deaminase-like protein
MPDADSHASFRKINPDEDHGQENERDALLGPLRNAPRGRAFVIAQLGQSLDGRIATVSGESRYINGRDALDHLHRIRAHVDAVVVGVGTVLADDPQLTVRRCAGASPARVVIDPDGRLPAGMRCMGQDGPRRLLVRRRAGPTPPGAEEIVIPCDGPIPPRRIVDALFSRGLGRMLIEGGARTISHFIDAGCVDRLHLLVAPLIIGSGRAGLELRPEPDLTRALRPPARVHLFADGDVLFDCDLAAPRSVAGEGGP